MGWQDVTDRALELAPLMGAAFAIGACVESCSVYSDELLDDASGEASSGGSDQGMFPTAAGGTGDEPLGSGGEMNNAGGAPSGAGGNAAGGSASGGASNEDDECRIAELVDPSTLPQCSDVGHADPQDGQTCSAGDDCADEACGFAGLGVKTCVCKADNTLNCSCSRPESYQGRCPADEPGCTELNRCVRGPSCVDYDLENVGAVQGTRAAMEGDLCANEWDQCVTADASMNEGCVCLRVSSSLPQWVCKVREGWFEAL